MEQNTSSNNVSLFFHSETFHKPLLCERNWKGNKKNVQKYPERFQIMSVYTPPSREVEHVSYSLDVGCTQGLPSRTAVEKPGLQPGDQGQHQ